MSDTKRDYPELDEGAPWAHDFMSGLDVVFAIRRTNWGVSLERGSVKPTKFYRYSPLFQTHRITFRRWLLEWHVRAYVPQPERYIVDDYNGPRVNLPPLPLEDRQTHTRGTGTRRR